MDIEAGRLQVVLPHLRLPASWTHAVYLHSRHTAAKVRLCVDFLRASLKRQWDASRPGGTDTVVTADFGEAAPAE